MSYLRLGPTELRVVEALVWLQQRLRVDKHGQCSICRPGLAPGGGRGRDGCPAHDSALGQALSMPPVQRTYQRPKRRQLPRGCKGSCR